MICMGSQVGCFDNIIASASSLLRRWMHTLLMLVFCVLCGTGLKPIWRGHMDEILSAAEGGPGWTPEQYLVTVESIMASAYNAVLLQDLKAKLGGKDGAKAVLAMVQAGLLGVRPPSGACLHVRLIFFR